VQVEATCTGLPFIAHCSVRLRWVSFGRLTVASLYLIIGLLVQLALGFRWKIYSSSRDTFEGFYHEMLAQTKEARYIVYLDQLLKCVPHLQHVLFIHVI
jgi:hypothetical protein